MEYKKDNKRKYLWLDTRRIIDGFAISKDFKSGEAIHYLSFYIFVQTISSVERVQIQCDENKHIFPMQIFGSVSDINNRFFSFWYVCSDLDIPVCIQYVRCAQPSLKTETIPDAPANFVLLKTTEHIIKLQYEMFKNNKRMTHNQNYFKIITNLNKIMKKGIPIKGEFISSKYIQDYFVSKLKWYNPQVHGPALKIKLDFPKYECDIVPYIHFEGWPDVAYDWISRKRPNTWPSCSVINDIIASGYGVVPVSSGTYNTSDKEWRLSFSMSEKLLFKNIAYGKLVFYYLVKKTFRSMLPKCEIFKSYHIKTLYFWYMEEVPDMHFYTENYGQIMINYFDRILLAIAEKKITHYFISSVNLLSGINNKQSKVLYRIINSYRLKLLSSFDKISNWEITINNDFGEVIVSTCCSLLPSQSSKVCIRNNRTEFDDAIALSTCCSHYCSIKSIEECWNHSREHFPSFMYILSFYIGGFIGCVEQYSFELSAKMYIVVCGHGYLQEIKQRHINPKIYVDYHYPGDFKSMDIYHEGDIFTVMEKKVIRKLACLGIDNVPSVVKRVNADPNVSSMKLSKIDYNNLGKIKEIIKTMPFPDKIHFDKSIFSIALRRPPDMPVIRKIYDHLHQAQVNYKFNFDINSLSKDMQDVLHRRIQANKAMYDSFLNI